MTQCPGKPPSANRLCAAKQLQQSAFNNQHNNAQARARLKQFRSSNFFQLGTEQDDEPRQHVKLGKVLVLGALGAQDLLRRAAPQRELCKALRIGSLAHLNADTKGDFLDLAAAAGLRGRIQIGSFHTGNLKGKLNSSEEEGFQIGAPYKNLKGKLTSFGEEEFQKASIQETASTQGSLKGKDWRGRIPNWKLPHRELESFPTGNLKEADQFRTAKDSKLEASVQGASQVPRARWRSCGQPASAESDAGDRWVPAVALPPLERMPVQFETSVALCPESAPQLQTSGKEAVNRNLPKVFNRTMFVGKHCLCKHFSLK